MCAATTLHHSPESSEKRRNVIIPEEQECWKPTLIQTLTGIKSWTQKHGKGNDIIKSSIRTRNFFSVVNLVLAFKVDLGLYVCVMGNKCSHQG